MTTRRLDRYTTVAIVLHWLIAAAIVFQVILAWRMGVKPRTPETFAFIQLHKSVGMTILALSLIRLGWRLANPPPPMPAAMPLWEKVAAKAVHWAFYGVMIGAPLTGWLMVSTSKTRIPTVLYNTLPLPSFPGVAAMDMAQRHGLHELGEFAHSKVGWILYFLLALHVLAALKHQLFNRDEVLSHMAPGAKPGRWLEPRLLLIALGFAAVVAGGYALHLKPAPPQVPDQTPTRAPPDLPPVPVSAPPVGPPQPSQWRTSRASTIGFKTSWSTMPIAGRFRTWDADILFSPDALDKSKVSVSIDVASATTGDVQRDAVLPTDDWFDADHHPKAVFTSSSFRKTGPDRYVANGRVSLRGVSKAVSLPFTLKITGDRARMDGVTRLDRTAFGVGQGEWTNTDQIPAQVTVTVGLTATRG